MVSVIQDCERCDFVKKENQCEMFIRDCEYSFYFSVVLKSFGVSFSISNGTNCPCCKYTDIIYSYVTILIVLYANLPHVHFAIHFNLRKQYKSAKRKKKTEQKFKPNKTIYTGSESSNLSVAKK